MADAAPLFLLLVLTAGCKGSSGGSPSGCCVASGGPAVPLVAHGQVLVNPGSAGLVGVQIELAGDTTATTTTEADGAFSLTVTGDPNARYLLTPRKLGYSFSPPRLTLTQASDAAQRGETVFLSNQLFVAFADATLSGSVTTGVVYGKRSPVAGAALSLSGAKNLTATTNSNGRFDFPGLQPGSYTVTASAPGLAFHESSRSVDIAGLDQTMAFWALTPAAKGFCSPGGFCWEHPLPQGNTLRALWSSGPSDAWAVGDFGTILHYDGAAWTESPSGTSTQFGSVTGSGPGDVWVTAAQAGGTLLHFDGTAWSQIPAPQDDFGLLAYNPFAAAVSDGAGAVWVLSTAGDAVRWDGVAWRTQQFWNNPGDVIFGKYEFVDLNGIGGSSPNDRWVVGGGSVAYGGIHAVALHFDGTSWTDLSPQYPGFGDQQSGLQSVWSSGPGDAWAADGNGVVFHYDGIQWHMQTYPGSTWENPWALGSHLWGSGPNDVWAVSSLSPYRHRGGQWLEEPLPASTFRDGIWFPDLYPGSKAVWGSGPDDVWTAGPQGNLFHFDGGGFSPLTASPLTTGNLMAVWESGPSDRWANSDTEIFHDGGAGWAGTNAGALVAELVARFGDPRCGGESLLSGLWGGGPGDVFSLVAVATNCNGLLGGSRAVAVLIHHDDSGWHLLEPQPLSGWRINSLWSSGRGEFWTVAGSEIDHYAGGSWSTSTAEGTWLHALWGTGPSDAWAVGEHQASSTSTLPGATLHWDGAAWREVTNPSPAPLVAVWGSAANDYWAVGLDTILHYDGGVAWTRVAGVQGCLVSVWGSGPGDIWVAGATGTGWFPACTREALLGRLIQEGAASTPGVLYHYDGNAWSLQETRTPPLLGVWGSGAGDVTVVGASGAILSRRR